MADKNTNTQVSYSQEELEGPNQRKGLARNFVDAAKIAGSGLLNIATAPNRYIEEKTDPYVQGLEKMIGDKQLTQLAMDSASMIGSIDPTDIGSLLKKRASALPMDEASRLARAEKMGFNPKETWYHGTNQDIPAFNPEIARKGEHIGSMGRDKIIRGGFFTKDPEFANDFTGSVGSNVMDVHLAAKKPFDTGNKELVDNLHKVLLEEKLAPNWVLKEIVERGAPTPEQLDVGNYANWHIYENPAVLKKIKEMGFDAVDIFEKGRKNRAVFNPEAIRSTRAAFNPKSSKSKNILAGVAGATALGAGMGKDE